MKKLTVLLCLTFIVHFAFAQNRALGQVQTILSETKGVILGSDGTIVPYCDNLFAEKGIHQGANVSYSLALIEGAPLATGLTIVFTQPTFIEGLCLNFYVPSGTEAEYVDQSTMKLNLPSGWVFYEDDGQGLAEGGGSTTVSCSCSSSYGGCSAWISTADPGKWGCTASGGCTTCCGTKSGIKRIFPVDKVGGIQFLFNANIATNPNKDILLQAYPDGLTDFATLHSPPAELFTVSSILSTLNVFTKGAFNNNVPDFIAANEAAPCSTYLYCPVYFFGYTAFFPIARTSDFVTDNLMQAYCKAVEVTCTCNGTQSGGSGTCVQTISNGFANCKVQSDCKGCDLKTGLKSYNDPNRACE